MYYSFGTKGGLETLIALSKPYSGETPIRDQATLKAAYHRFLAHYQPSVPAPASGRTSFAVDPELVDTLAGFFRVKSWLNDRNQGNMIEGQFSDVLDRVRTLECGLHELEAVDKEFVEFFRLAINHVFCASSTLAGGGTTSSALGVIWAAHRDRWSQTDVFEFFVHELTHNMVFLDECRFRHYPDYPALSLKENFAQSAILSIRRPLDKVVHSLMVATEVLLFRENISGHPPTSGLHPVSSILIGKAATCVASISSLPNLEQLTTERCRQLLSRAADVIGALEDKYEVCHEQKPDFESVPLAI